jgi:hypothetical protein
LAGGGSPAVIFGGGAMWRAAGANAGELSGAARWEPPERRKEAGEWRLRRICHGGLARQGGGGGFRSDEAKTDKSKNGQDGTVL